MGNKKAKDSFISKVSKYGTGRKHIEVPKGKRKKFKAGDYVQAEKLK